MILRAVVPMKEHGGSWTVRIPPRLREALYLRPGDLVLLTLVDDNILLTRYAAERILPRQQARQIVTNVANAAPSKVAND